MKPECLNCDICLFNKILQIIANKVMAVLKRNFEILTHFHAFMLLWNFFTAFIEAFQNKKNS